MIKIALHSRILCYNNTVSIFLYYYSKKGKEMIMKKIKRCLVVIEDDFNKNHKEKLEKLIEDGVRYFYFVNIDNLSQQICDFLHRLNPEIYCYFLHNHQNICWNKLNFDFNLPIYLETKEKIIDISLKNVSCVVTDNRNLIEVKKTFVD